MDGREGMSSFYLNRGLTGSGSNAGSGSPGSGLQIPPPGFKTQSNPNPNPNIAPHGHNMRVASMGSSFQMEHNPSPTFRRSITGGSVVSSGSGSGGAVTITAPTEPVVKKKRGRPRKYGPDGSHVALGLTPAAPPAAPLAAPVAGSGSPGSGSPTPKKNRGRPRGSGRKQRLADVGEWMHNSAGMAFTPHIIHVEIGEDVAAKILSFAQQRPRALCVLSAHGGVSAVALRQFSSSGGTVTYEGLFEILCLSGSYLLPETGAPHNRTGGLSISICSADGHVIGGAIGGRLVASSLVQVVVCSFVYGSNIPKIKTKNDTPSKDENSPGVELNESSLGPSQRPIAWPPQDMRNSHAEIDLTRG